MRDAQARDEIAILRESLSDLTIAYHELLKFVAQEHGVEIETDRWPARLARQWTFKRAPRK